MIIQIFNNVENSATGAVDYCLSHFDSNGKIREVDPKILKGDENFTRSLDEQAKSIKCISGVLAFSDNEKLTDEQKLKLIEDFEKTFFGNMNGKINALYIEHYDKSNLEIHFIINRVAILEDNSIKAFNPFPPGQMTIDLKDAFRDLQNHKFGFKHVEELDKLKLDKPKKSRKFSKKSFENIKTKDKLDLAIKDLVRNGDVTNRDELLKFLVENGYKVKANPTSISVEVEKISDDYTKKYGRNIRLSGGIYARNDDKSYEQIKTENVEKIKKGFEPEKALKTLTRIVEARNQYNTDRYKVAMKKAPSFAKNIVNSSNAQQNEPQRATGTKGMQPLGHTEKTAQKPVKQESSKVDDVKNESSKGFTSDDEPKAFDSVGSSSLGNEAMGAQQSVNNARTKLANARTIEERIQAEHQLAIAQANLDRVLASLTKTKIKI